MTAAPKRIMPKVSVNKGDNEFKIPAIVLLNCVCAEENKKAGIALPVEPTINNHFHFDQSIRFQFQITTGAKAKAEIEIRKDATWSGEKATNAFLIRINELPHTILNPMRITKLTRLRFDVESSIFLFIGAKVVELCYWLMLISYFDFCLK
jgi:hypothetical protein